MMTIALKLCLVLAAGLVMSARTMQASTLKDADFSGEYGTIKRNTFAMDNEGMTFVYQK